MMTKFATLKIENGVAVETDVMNLDLSTIPSSDPLSFAWGLRQGQNCLKNKTEPNHGSKHTDLSQEYLRGFLVGYRGILVPEGTKMKKGDEISYRLSHLNTLKT